MSRITSTLFLPVLALVLCSLPAQSFGQVDSIISLPEAERPIALATMAMYEGRIAEEEWYMDYAAKNKTKYQVEMPITFFSNLYTYTRLKGDYAKAVQYTDSLDHY